MPSPSPRPPAAAGRPRIAPEDALRPGLFDARALLTVWSFRRLTISMFALGIVIAFVASRDGEIDARVDSVEDWEAGLLSPAAGIILALTVRVLSNLAALVLAYPLTRDHEVGLEPRPRLGRMFGVWGDRLNLAAAYRSLRWTWHVRRVAMARLGGRAYRLDPMLSAINVAMVVLAVIVLFGVAAVRGG